MPRVLFGRECAPWPGPCSRYKVLRPNSSLMPLKGCRGTPELFVELSGPPGSSRPRQP